MDCRISDVRLEGVSSAYGFGIKHIALMMTMTMRIVIEVRFDWVWE